MPWALAARHLPVILPPGSFACSLPLLLRPVQNTGVAPNLSHDPVRFRSPVLAVPGARLFQVWKATLVGVLAFLSSRAETDYRREVKPLLAARCYACHGALQQKAKLRLDTVDAIRRGGVSGPAIIPGEASRSLLFARVSATDLAERMPPEHEGEPLSATQREVLRAWIEGGAPGVPNEVPEADPRSHWAFRPPVHPAVPRVQGSDWVRHGLDAFIAAYHEAQGLRPQPEADRRLLIRRLYMDLIGLPPSWAELQVLLADSRPEWYERLVDRLLDDPRHGERWARHWMDIWRYSDGWGLGDQHRNSQKHIWHWRDWIVESLNADVPYDTMLREMLAADETHPDDLGALRATGFLVRNYFLFNRNQWLDETVEHVGKAFLGLTLNCAKCHDHKYDPIAQPEYYRMRAFFEPYHARLDVLPGEPDLARDGLPRAFDRTLDPPTYRFVRGQENAPDTSKPLAPEVPEFLNFASLAIHPVPLPPDAWQPERRSWVLAAHEERARENQQRKELAAAEARLRFASAAAPSVDSSRLRVAESERTLALAELSCVQRRAAAMRAAWAAATNGIPKTTADATRIEAVRAERRVTAARAQVALAQAELRLAQAAPNAQEAAGKEVASARDAAAKADRDSTADIPPTERFTPLPGTQWTATRFLDSTKDDPDVDPIPFSSGRRRALAEWITDPRHPLTARVAVNHVWNRHFGIPLVPAVFDFGRKNAAPTHPELLDWLASELVDHGWSLKHLHRLIVTSATYRMSSSATGAETNLIRDPDNRGWWRRPPVRLEAQVIRDMILAHSGRLEAHLGGPPVAAAEQDTSSRRSLYFYHSNNERNPLLATFDDATVKECYRREQSIVPQQALALMNSRLAQEGAADIARQLTRTAVPTISPKADDAFVRAAFESLLGFSPRPPELAACRQALVARRGRDGEANALAARQDLIWALLNHHDFVTLR